MTNTRWKMETHRRSLRLQPRAGSQRLRSALRIEATSVSSFLYIRTEKKPSQSPAACCHDAASDACSAIVIEN